MPNLGLTEEEAAEVLAYIELNTVAAPDQAAEPMPDLMLTSGSVEGGRLLFVGEVQLANGGPACISCHNVAGVGALGGGTLGPDLTSVYNRYGEKGLAAALEGLPFPTMQGVFGDKPLRSDEAAHLFAFFVQANKYSAEPADEYFVWIGLGGFLSLLVISHLIWRLRLRAVRKPLLGRHA
jgi:cytochrome c553